MHDRRTILSLALAAGLAWVWPGSAGAAADAATRTALRPVRLGNGMYLLNNWLLTAADLRGLGIDDL